ncbi:MAG: adenylate/guanylate cyclase domain-containing protein [Ferruginibacter sp.]|nr:adenylate/guanylate cyclase domain-containing protein [Ferruginibacter sp.]
MSSSTFSIFQGIKKFRIRRVFYIAIFWMFIDMVSTILNFNTHESHTKSILLRAILVFCMSGIMGYLFVFTLRNIFKNKPLLLNFFAKAFILLFAALAMNFLAHFLDDLFVDKYSVGESFKNFYYNIIDGNWLLKRTLYWLILFAVTQLYLEINDKYAPGVFLDILSGKYIKPKIENRIIMFIDLKDSTPIAEKMGHQQYFLFIREFIYFISLALIENNGIIYQYVGDEIVVSWKYNKKNMKECLASIIAARKNIQKKSEHFRRIYGTIPEFRIGIHTGDVTVGEIGVIKKDLAMSGDTMNTTARIRSACNELNQKFIESKHFADKSNLKGFQM